MDINLRVTVSGSDADQIHLASLANRLGLDAQSLFSICL